MKNYVDGLLESELPRAVENVGVKMLHVTQEFTKTNSLSNSRMYIEYQTAIIRGIEEYGSLLRERLGQFDPKHAPLGDADFNKAIASIDTLKAEALPLYTKKRENQKAFGGNGVAFEEGRLIASVQSAKNELVGLQSSFRSHRSILQRFTDKIIDTVGQQTALWLASSAGFVLGLVFNAAVDWLKHIGG